jgi:hypothetical protein
LKRIDATYVLTDHFDYLELHCSDGSVRGVIFRDAAAAFAAARPGRAELDCMAVSYGFLPKGATLVSSPGVNEAAFGDDEELLRQARARTAAALYVTKDSDREAGKRSPKAAARYDEMTATDRTLH